MVNALQVKIYGIDQDAVQEEAQYDGFYAV